MSDSVDITSEKSNIEKYLKINNVMYFADDTELISEARHKTYNKQVLSGKEFNNIFTDVNLVKLTNETENHQGFQFADGLNVDTHKFTPFGICAPGGIYFIEEHNV